MPEDKILAVVSKAEEATAARVSSVAWLPTVSLDLEVKDYTLDSNFNRSNRF